MEVTFIRHSCFFVELQTCCLLFDWFEGEIPATDKPLYVFASHSHSDHFSPAVFDLPRESRETFYLLSGDIPARSVPQRQMRRTVFLSPHQTLTAGPLRIQTLRSTDAGVAFLVEVEDQLLYHAGDLNCWVWAEAGEEDNRRMTRLYCRQLEHLRGRNIHVAFVPLDPRQEDDYALGMRYFFEIAGAGHVFPMHMWGDYSVVRRFRSDPAHAAWADRVMDVQAVGQRFSL